MGVEVILVLAVEVGGISFGVVGYSKVLVVVDTEGF